MGLPTNNLLLRLHKWAHRQDENFLTDAFTHLMQHLLFEEPEAAVRLLEFLTDGFFQVRPADAKRVKMRTQVVLPGGTPDLEIWAVRHLAYVEVKAEADVDWDQLNRYRRLLHESGASATALILLTRYPVVPKAGAEPPNAFLRWYQVAEKLQQERGRYRFKAVSDYLVSQFLEFLSVRNMVMEQVTWELSGGVRALRMLTIMLGEAANACGLRVTRYANNERIGVYLNKDEYWVGIYWDYPETLTFETYTKQVDKEAAARLGLDGVWEGPRGGYGWSRELNLQAEDVHFFARPTASQMECLEDFLRECLTAVRQIACPSIGGTAGAMPEIAASEPEEGPAPSIN